MQENPGSPDSGTFMGASYCSMLVTAGRTKAIANSDAVKVICPSTLGRVLRSCSGILSRSTPSGIRKTFFSLPTVLAAEYVRSAPRCVSLFSFYTCLRNSGPAGCCTYRRLRAYG